MKLTLKSARLVSGLTADQVASSLGMNINTVYKYENFKSYPTVDVANKMAELYGVKFEDLIFFQ